MPVQSPQASYSCSDLVVIIVWKCHSLAGWGFLPPPGWQEVDSHAHSCSLTSTCVLYRICAYTQEETHTSTFPPHTHTVFVLLNHYVCFSFWKQFKPDCLQSEGPLSSTWCCNDFNIGQRGNTSPGGVLSTLLWQRLRAQPVMDPKISLKGCNWCKS